MEGAQLGSVEVGLETGFENVERGGQGRGSHSADAVDDQSFTCDSPDAFSGCSYPPATK